jgi:hypothetical protein
VEPTTRPRLRVALSAAPPLLADSLRVLLSSEDTDVTVIVEGGGDRYDVGIVTPGAAAVEADVLIVLDDSRDALGGGTVRRDDELRELSDLQAVLSTVRGLRPRPVG